MKYLDVDELADLLRQSVSTVRRRFGLAQMPYRPRCMFLEPNAKVAIARGRELDDRNRLEALERPLSPREDLGIQSVC